MGERSPRGRSVPHAAVVSNHAGPLLISALLLTGATACEDAQVIPPGERTVVSHEEPEAQERLQEFYDDSGIPPDLLDRIEAEASCRAFFMVVIERVSGERTFEEALESLQRSRQGLDSVAARNETYEPLARAFREMDTAVRGRADPETIERAVNEVFDRCSELGPSPLDAPL